MTLPGRLAAARSWAVGTSASFVPSWGARPSGCLLPRLGLFDRRWNHQASVTLRGRLAAARFLVVGRLGQALAARWRAYLLRRCPSFFHPHRDPAHWADTAASEDWDTAADRGTSPPAAWWAALAAPAVWVSKAASDRRRGLAVRSVPTWAPSDRSWAVTQAIQSCEVTPSRLFGDRCRAAEMSTFGSRLGP
jgi:hypothetical protein